MRCALGHATCVLGERDKTNGKLLFSTFDLAQKRKNELLRLDTDLAGSAAWDLSPDGSAVAIVDLDEHQDRIRVVELKNGSSRWVPLGVSQRLSGITWFADGKGWFVTSLSTRGASIFRVSSNGKVSDVSSSPKLR